MSLGQLKAEKELEEIIAALRQRIRDSQDNEGAQKEPTVSAVPLEVSVPSPSPSGASVPIDFTTRRYTLGQITGVDDSTFVSHLYRCLLKREPDEAGLVHHMQMLASGSKSKADIAIDLSVSPEASAAGTSLELPLGTRLYRMLVSLPLVGGLMRTGAYLARIQGIAVSQQQDHYQLLALGKQVLELAVTSNQTADRVTALSVQIDGARRELQRTVQRVYATLGYLDSQKASADEADELRLEIENVIASQKRQEARVSEMRITAEAANAELARLKDASASAANQIAELGRLNDASASAANQIAEQSQAHGRVLSEITIRLARIDQLQLELQLELEQVKQDVVSRATAADLGTRLTLEGMQTELDLQIPNRVKFELESLLGSHDRLGVLERSLSQAKSRIVDMDRRLLLVLEELRKRLPAPLYEAQVERSAMILAGLPDATYVNFEDVYRGTRDDIKSRQAIYVPKVREVIACCDHRVPVLDLGCGRGEWLEVLRDHGIKACGVDSNSVMVQQCRELGFDVAEQDAISHVAGLPSSSVAVLTGFHVIEHLPLDKQVRLMDEALRALVPGGFLILETPNPANLQVGGNSFYLDPTHIKPIPAPQLMFLLEARGFVQAEILLLHPAQPPDGVSETVEGRLIQQLLYGPQDYAVLARKA